MRLNLPEQGNFLNEVLIRAYFLKRHIVDDHPRI